MTGSSRTEPPGWTNAVTPPARHARTPSANGKNASDAHAAPAARSPAFSTASRARVDAAHLTGSDAHDRAVAREDDGIRLHVAARRARRAPGRAAPSAVGSRDVATRQVVEVVGGRCRTRSRAAPRRRSGTRRRPTGGEPMGRIEEHPQVPRAGPGSGSASSSTAGATTTSRNIEVSRSASEALIGRRDRDHAAVRAHRVAGTGRRPTPPPASRRSPLPRRGSCASRSRTPRRAGRARSRPPRTRRGCCCSESGLPWTWRMPVANGPCRGVCPVERGTARRADAGSRRSGSCSICSRRRTRVRAPPAACRARRRSARRSARSGRTPRARGADGSDSPTARSRGAPPARARTAPAG